jgi:hypothetical protein
MHEVHREEALVSTPSVNKASDVSHIEKAWHVIMSEWISIEILREIVVL